MAAETTKQIVKSAWAARRLGRGIVRTLYRWAPALNPRSFPFELFIGGRRSDNGARACYRGTSRNLPVMSHRHCLRTFFAAATFVATWMTAAAGAAAPYPGGAAAR